MKKESEKCGGREEKKRMRDRDVEIREGERLEGRADEEAKIRGIEGRMYTAGR